MVGDHIPIVAIGLERNPVRRGYAASLVRPGGNTTGAFLDTPEIVRKWLEVLKASIPQLARVAVIWDDCMGSGAYLTVSGLGGSLKSSCGVVCEMTTRGKRQGLFLREE
jgi:hypothetical protein